MNFNDLGNAPEKKYVDNVELTIVNIVNGEKDQFGNFTQEVLGKDVLGTQEPFRIQTKYPESLLANDDLNLTLPFRLKWYNSKTGPKLVGYCTRPKQQGQPAQPPQQARQVPVFGSSGPKQAPQNTQSAFEAQEESRKRDLRIMRQHACMDALAFHALGKTAVTMDEVVSRAEAFLQYYQNGPESAPF
jgi:hypothetical protein